ncbi:MAG: class I SAM-dependent methyltransferase [Rhodocyclaceae bacterium]|nr:class I SAM-dependent methyltransferase [Rhodocyclaceae bacterium]MBX3670290.1 class I SAM-dependent methyltransferase [Rhodocyclaceae bacterium]
MNDVHARLESPSEWVVRWASLFEPGQEVLDVACGSGRHARLLAACGLRVEAVDRDAGALAILAGEGGITTRLTDLEGKPWPYGGRSFAGIVVTNYLHRPLLSHLLGALAPGGILIYETFMAGNEKFGRPSNPDFLLREHELFEWVTSWGSVIAFEQGRTNSPRPAMVQRICAVKCSLAESKALLQPQD